MCALKAMLLYIEILESATFKTLMQILVIIDNRVQKFPASIYLVKVGIVYTL